MEVHETSRLSVEAAPAFLDEAWHVSEFGEEWFESIERLGAGVLHDPLCRAGPRLDATDELLATVRMVLTRRGFLVGAGAVTVTGAVSVAVVGPTRVLHRLGLRSSPDHAVPASGWPVKERTLASAAMKGDVRWAYAEPPVPPTGVIVCLHGRGGDRRFAFDSIHLHDVVANAGASLAVVAVDGGASSYWHPRADGTDALSMVLDELLPEIDAVLPANLPRVILGWSMGGYGALLMSERAPDKFHAVIAASPALWLQAGESASGAFDNAEDFAKYDVFADVKNLAGLAVRVDCGDGDGFAHAARVLASELPHPNLGGFGLGYHDDSYWRSIAPAQIATVVAALKASS